MPSPLKVLFLLFPQRTSPDFFPPYGCLAVMTAMKKAGFSNLSFYNIDALRPEFNEAIDHICSYGPDIIAISAPVSTAYGNVKTYLLELKKRLPNLIAVVGGNLATSAEVLLKKAKVDFCVIGEGEDSFCQLSHWVAKKGDASELRNIKGIAYCDDDGRMVFTGFGLQRTPDKMLDVDWNLLPSDNHGIYFPPISAPSSLRMFFPYSKGFPERLSDYDKQFLTKNWGIFLTSKGCVNRCTFCHRFIKGLRILPMDVLFSRLKEMVARFNLGYVQFGDECFGLNAKWIEEFCSRIEPMGLVWGVAGMRTDFVSPGILKRMKAAGCRIVNYGFETLSGKMLKVMEKGVQKQDNIQAMQWTIQADLNSITQLVIGMPGETTETIRETAECVGEFLTLDREQIPDVSVNYAQALPGTPLYEYGRAKGLIGTSVEEEEQYLLEVFNRNAADFASKTNFTAYPKFMLSVWNHQIRSLVNRKYAAVFGMDHYLKMTFPDGIPTVCEALKRRDLGSIIRLFPNLAYHLAPMIGVLYACKGGWKACAFTLRELLRYLLRDRPRLSRDSTAVSLRETLERMSPAAYNGSPEMIPLRRGM